MPSNRPIRALSGEPGRGHAARDIGLHRGEPLKERPDIQSAPPRELEHRWHDRQLSFTRNASREVKIAVSILMLITLALGIGAELLLGSGHSVLGWLLVPVMLIMGLFTVASWYDNR